MSLQPFEEAPQPIDPFVLATEAVTELTISANSGVADHEKVARLRRELGELTITRAEATLAANEEVPAELKFN